MYRKILNTKAIRLGVEGEEYLEKLTTDMKESILKLKKTRKAKCGNALFQFCYTEKFSLSTALTKSTFLYICYILLN
jgi:hypothetical protein